MFHNDTFPRLTRFDYGIVKRKARQLIGRTGITAQDRHDLEQELLTRLLQSLKSFDHRKAHRNAFVTAVVERDVANLLRDRRAAKRDHRRIGSLNVTIAFCEEGATEFADTISQREYDARRGRAPRRPEELADLRMDLVRAIAALEDADRSLVLALKSKSIAQIARELGIPRTTLQDRVQKLRQRFEQEGLRAYV